MDEQEFDSLFSAPFGTEDAMRMDARGRRSATLGTALWGKTVDDLERKLLAPHPEIPLGFDLADFQELQGMAQRILLYLCDPRSAWISRLSPCSAQDIQLGNMLLTMLRLMSFRYIRATNGFFNVLA